MGAGEDGGGQEEGGGKTEEDRDGVRGALRVDHSSK